MGLWTWAFGVDEENQKAGNDATRRLMQLNFQQMNDGKMSPAEYADRNARLQANLDDSANADSQIQDAFVEGAQDGLNNIASTIQKTTSGLTGGLFKLIPWQGWVVIIVVGAIYLFPLFKKLRA